MSISKMGAVVLYCGHDASFVADVFEVGNAVVVVGNGDLDKPGMLTRPAQPDCTHHVMDAFGGVWKPKRGFFAVPADGCRKLKPGSVEHYYGPRKKKGGAS